MSQSQNIGNIFQKMFKDLGIDKPMQQYQAVNLWPQVAGERVAEISTAEKIEKGVLYVRVDSPVWRNELVFMKSDIIQKLNKALSKSVVKDIKFI